MTYLQSIDLLKMCNELGIKRVKVAGIEAEFFEDKRIFATSEVKESNATYKDLIDSKVSYKKQDLSMPSNEELLTWSSGLEVLDEERVKHKPEA